MTPDNDPPWLAHRRKLFMRPDAHRWLRQDSERFERPNPPERKTHAQRAVERRQDDPGFHDPRPFASQILALKWNLAALRFQHALLRHELLLRRKANFDPSQPRVPAGNPGGGQWTGDSNVGARSDDEERMLAQAVD